MGRPRQNTGELRLKVDSDLRAWARALPKVDLHRHLEGSLRLNTLAEIGAAHQLDLPTHDPEELRPYVQIVDDATDHLEFLKIFQVLRHFYTSKEAVQRMAREAVHDAADDGVRYLELRFNPLALAKIKGFPLEDVVPWVIEAVEEAQAETQTRTCLILQIPRNETLWVAHEIIELAIAHFGPIVRGIDLAGDELSYPPERFIDPFRRAREAGLHITVHAGEWAGADSVNAALKFLHPERIGHGIRSIESSAAIRALAERRVTLEVCITSNLQTGAIRGYSRHPLPDLLNLNLRTTLNTDDPGISAITLADEYIRAHTMLGLPWPQIIRMLRYAVDAAFIPPEEKPGLLETFRRELARFPGALACFEAHSDGG